MILPVCVNHCEKEKCVCRVRQMNRQTDMNGWPDRQTDGQTDLNGWPDRQTDRPERLAVLGCYYSDDIVSIYAHDVVTTTMT